MPELKVFVKDDTKSFSLYFKDGNIIAFIKDIKFYHRI